jgi:hypothetical protein
MWYVDGDTYRSDRVQVGRDVVRRLMVFAHLPGSLKPTRQFQIKNMAP